MGTTMYLSPSRAIEECCEQQNKSRGGEMERDTEISRSIKSRVVRRR